MVSPTGRLRLAAQVGMAAFLVLVGAAQAASAVPGFPWEALIAVAFAACLALWLGIARQPLSGLGFRRYPGWLGHAAAAAAAGFLVSLVLYGGSAAAGIAAPTRVPTPGGVLIAILVLGPLVALVSTALPEEAIFRGFFQRGLTAWLGPGAAIVLSALLFAVGHLPNRTRGHLPPGGYLLVELGMLAVFGLLMSWTVVRTGALWIAIGYHFGGNLPDVVQQFTIGLEAQGPSWLVGIPPAVDGGGLLDVIGVALQALVLVVLMRLLGVTAAQHGPPQT